MLSNAKWGQFTLAAGIAFSLAACESSGSYRLSSVGNVPGDSTASSGGDTGSGSSGGGSTASSGGSGGTGSPSSSGGQGALGAGNLLVTAGNAVMGVAGTNQAISGGVLLPATGEITGTVTRVLDKTGQTLVDIGQGNTLILGKAGGAVGDLLRIDLGSHTVVGAPNKSALLGAGVLSPAGSGNLVAVSANNALDLTANASGGLLNGGLLNGATSGLAGAIGATASTPAGSANAGATTAASGPITGVTNTVSGVVNGSANTATGTLGGGASGNSGLLGTGLLNGKKGK